MGSKCVWILFGVVRLWDILKWQILKLVIIIMIDLIKAATLTNNRELQKNAENTILKQRN